VKGGCVVKTHWILLAILFILIFGGCSPSPSADENSPALTATNGKFKEDATQVPSSNSSRNQPQAINTLDDVGMTSLPADINPFVRVAEQNLADDLNISTDQITFLKITEINWQDITQGCAPTPGQTLTKGRLSGYRIWLEANGKNYVYHIGLDHTIFLCPD
jgi:hypothetical protein